MTDTKTRHDARCEMSFGRPKATGCPRCAELLAGAPARQWAGQRTMAIEREQVQAIRAHFTSARHLSGGCGPVCTFGEW